MNKNTKIGIGIGILGLLCVFTLLSTSAVVPAQTNEQVIVPIQEPSQDNGVTKIGYDGYVTVYKIEAATGKKILVEERKHNLITTIGKNFIKAKLNGSDVTAANNLTSVSLTSDATAPDAAWGSLVSELTTNGFLRNGTATWTVNGTNGFNVTATWTATGSQADIQTTGLQWSSIPSSAGNLFAALAFTPQSMLVNDQLQVIWQVVIS